MTATVPAQSTAAAPPTPGPLTAPLEIIRAAEARHRLAVAEGDALPGWALIAVAIITAAIIVFGVLEWRDVASPLLIACALLGAAAAFTPDLLAARRTTDTRNAD